MADRPTEAVWVTRQIITVQHIRGLLVGLEQAKALDYAQIKLMVPQGFLVFNEAEMPLPETPDDHPE